MSKYSNDNDAYLFEAADMRKLEQIKTRLYAPEPLTGDERRDLANTMDAVMGKATEIDCDLPAEFQDEDPH